jgi:hypothetical protein
VSSAALLRCALAISLFAFACHDRVHPHVGRCFLDTRETAARLVGLRERRPEAPARDALHDRELEAVSLAAVPDDGIRGRMATWRGELILESGYHILFRLALEPGDRQEREWRGVVYPCPPSRLHVQREDGRILGRFRWWDYDWTGDLLVVHLENGVLAFRRESVPSD